MTDRPDSKKPSIPAWQTSLPEDGSDSSPKTSKDAGGEITAQDRNTTVEQAKTFLEDASVRDAPREKKVAFLEKKGLHGEEIQKLLDSTSSEPASPAVQGGGIKTVHDSSPFPSSPFSSSASHTPPSTSSSPQPKPASQPKPDTPPIITYPEFLLRPSKPPPLITLERLSYTLYTLAGISALTYGASKHLIQPMLHSLTSSRDDLANTAIHNLEKLNKKLEGNVSHIPAMSNSVLLKERDRERHGDDNNSDVETIDSDPTELFHRDIATQTSPQLTHSSSMASSSSTSSSALHTKNKDKDPTTTQSTLLTTLSTSLSSLLTTESSTTTTQETLLSTISDCQSFLDKLQYSMNSYADYNFLYGSAPPAKDDKSRSTEVKERKEGGKEEEDEAMRFRQEIRSVKGALLSVRNFPVGRPATGGVGVR